MLDQAIQSLLLQVIFSTILSHTLCDLTKIKLPEKYSLLFDGFNFSVLEEIGTFISLTESAIETTLLNTLHISQSDASPILSISRS